MPTPDAPGSGRAAGGVVGQVEVAGMEAHAGRCPETEVHMHARPSATPLLQIARVEKDEINLPKFVPCRR